jgi:hypothetical protein
MKTNPPLLKKRSATTLCQALPDYFYSGLFSDVRLQFCDNSHQWRASHSNTNTNNDGAEPDQSQQTSRVVMELKLHKFVLYSGSVPTLTKLMDRQYRDLRPDCDTIRVELNFDIFCPEVVRFFFSLIYYNKLARVLELGGELAQKVDENILQLHQLASYYGFDALINICHARMFRLFSSNNVADFSTHCLQPLAQQPGHFYVPGEKRFLYAKLLHWYQLCIDDVGAGASLFGGGASILRRKATSMTGGHSSYGNKTVVIGQKKKWVEGFEQFQLPPACSTTTMMEDGSGRSSTRIQHYRRICVDCINKPRLIHKGHAVINMGVLDEQWSFSMTYPLAPSPIMTTTTTTGRNLMMFLKKHQSSAGNNSMMVEDSGGATTSSSEEHMSVEQQECTRLCSTIRLFSQNIDDEQCGNVRHEVVETVSNLAELTRVGCIALHPEEDCYVAVCDRCQQEDAVFIFCLSVDVIK